MRHHASRLVLACAAVAAATACKSTDQDTGTESLVRGAGGDGTIVTPAGVELDVELGEHSWPQEQELAQEIGVVIAESIKNRYPASNRPARRDAHPKAHGCVRAEFKVESQLDQALAHGAFKAGRSYKAWIRFSNGDGDATRADGEGDARGMAIKLMGVPGAKLLASERDAETQDFVMINHPVFFMDDPKQYLNVIKKVNSSNPLVRLAAPAALGLKGALIARDITKIKIPNPLQSRYWSMVPYRLGDEESKQAIKFSAKPCSSQVDPVPSSSSDKDYLRKAMAKTLSQGEGCFDFLVQARTTPSMSVENSMTEWKEAEAPFVKVATITIPQQTFDSDAQMTFCDNLSFTPWHSLPEHRPLGAVNRVRRVVYEQISALRHQMNEAPRREPTGDETF